MTRKPVVYLASRFSRFEEMREHKALLEDNGYVVNARWLNGGHEWSGIDDAEILPEVAQQFAIEDLEDIGNADMVWAFTEDPRSGHSRGGRHVEAGYCLALHKPLIVIGPRENVFYTLDVGAGIEAEAHPKRYDVAGSVCNYFSIEVALTHVPKAFPYLWDKDAYSRVQANDLYRQLRSLRQRIRTRWHRDAPSQRDEVVSATENLMLRVRAYASQLFENNGGPF